MSELSAGENLKVSMMLAVLKSKTLPFHIKTTSGAIFKVVEIKENDIIPVVICRDDSDFISFPLLIERIAYIYGE
ncbi:MAG TPA: hypothetical protein VK190_03435 [Pseudoneobacillus sp.]|nr:hypothetical protein [Pseudoneobacillus sp.]